MPLCEFHWASAILGKHVTTRVILPSQGKPPFATFYLLHGLSDDHTIWSRRTRIEEYVAGLPLIVVMPDGGRGFYTNHEQGPAYATHFGEELPATIEHYFPAKPARSARCIGGLSMGGYGAMRIGLGYPETFVSVNSHSGALDFAVRKGVGGHFPGEFELIFGDKKSADAHDLLKLAKKCKAAGVLPKLLIDCGAEDFLLSQNHSFVAGLKRMKIPHIYREFPGAHTWEYWDAHVREAIAFHAEAMKLGRG